MHLSQSFKNYINIEIISAGLSTKTKESYMNAEKLAESYFGDCEVSDITAEDVRKYYEHLLEWQQPDTARGNILNLRAVLRRCARKGEITLDLEDFKVPKRQKHMIQWLTEAEFEEFAEIVAKKRQGLPEINRLRNVAIVYLLYSSGIRVSELCSLNRNSIKNRQFTVIGKSKSPRICFINQAANERLDEYLSARSDRNPALFISNQNEKRMTTANVRTIFRNICKNSDFENVHPHTLRHSFATKMLDHNVDIRYISELMGHESLDTTRIYTHFANPKLKDIYDNANR